MPYQNNNIPLILLAGGKSSRMKKPKGLLRYNKKYKNKLFIEEQITRFYTSGGQTIILIVGHHYINYKKKLNKIRKKYPYKFLHIIYNKNYKQGQFSSIHSGLEIFKSKNINTSGVFIHPIDVPLSKSALKKIAKLNDTIMFHQNSNLTIIPQYRNKSGHPIFINNTFIKYILSNYSEKNLYNNRLDYIIKQQSIIKYISSLDKSTALNLNNKLQYQKWLKEKN